MAVVNRECQLGTYKELGTRGYQQDNTWQAGKQINEQDIPIMKLPHAVIIFIISGFVLNCSNFLLALLGFPICFLFGYQFHLADPLKGLLFYLQDVLVLLLAVVLDQLLCLPPQTFKELKASLMMQMDSDGLGWARTAFPHKPSRNSKPA